MPSVPPVVAARVVATAREADLAPRGMPAALERFYARLAQEGRAPEQAQAEDFAACAPSRTALRRLLAALGRFAPEVPTAAAVPVKQDWDRWLNARYNAKPRRPCASRREALAPEDWPAPWQAARPCLTRRCRVGERRYRALAPKTRASVEQAVGLLALARARAGIEAEGIDAELAEAFLAFLLDRVNPRTGAPIRAASVADYVERVTVFGQRAQLLTPAGEVALAEIARACRDEAEEETPLKEVAIRRFREAHGLDAVLARAVAASEQAAALPGHSAEAARLRRKAVVFALLVNNADRQGDLSTFRIGREVVRGHDGWSLAHRQTKTGRWKDNGPLWTLVSLLLDAHVLAGRPSWTIDVRLAELDGCNLLSLAPEGFGTYYAASLLREEFGIGGHLIRTALTDLLRRHRPDAAWAVQRLLGHSVRWMQETYRSDFEEVASVEHYAAALETLLARTDGAGQGRRPRL
ncbi:hypothetical protein [Rhodosalinus sediminis]|uniref:hypothetical protein n=1 Tax=Rhodosalinus sediminis TaxID=1940533 RepID=UPI001313DEC4|nr:hypothetical protein [Rhodosalinus sediminis]